jgi:hypothetical protein
MSGYPPVLFLALSISSGVVEDRYQVAQAAPQAVEFPHDQRVTVFQFLQASEMGRALGRGSR